MYLRITRGRFDPAKYDDVLPLTREVDAAVQAMPAARVCTAPWTALVAGSRS